MINNLPKNGAHQLWSSQLIDSSIKNTEDGEKSEGPTSF